MLRVFFFIIQLLTRHSYQRDHVYSSVCQLSLVSVLCVSQGSRLSFPPKRSRSCSGLCCYKSRAYLSNARALTDLLLQPHPPLPPHTHTPPWKNCLFCLPNVAFSKFAKGDNRNCAVERSTIHLLPSAGGSGVSSEFSEKVLV